MWKENIFCQLKLLSDSQIYSSKLVCFTFCSFLYYLLWFHCLFISSANKCCSLCTSIYFDFIMKKIEQCNCLYWYKFIVISFTWNHWSVNVLCILIIFIHAVFGLLWMINVVILFLCCFMFLPRVISWECMEIIRLLGIIKWDFMAITKLSHCLRSVATVKTNLLSLWRLYLWNLYMSALNFDLILVRLLRCVENSAWLAIIKVTWLIWE